MTDSAPELRPGTGARVRGRVGTALIALGVTLLAFAGGATLVGRLQKERDLRLFREALAAPAPPALSEPAPDTSKWAPERKKAWEDSRKVDTRLPLAILRIPKIKLEVPVLAGTDEPTLNRAVGLVEDSPRPGESGNVAIAGHRDGWFRGLMDVSPGDALELQTLTGLTTYTVEYIRIVDPDDVSVLEPTAGPAVTLVTCYPFYFVGSAPQRYIVRAVGGPGKAAAARADLRPVVASAHSP